MTARGAAGRSVRKRRGVFLTFGLRKKASAAIHPKLTRTSREGFAVAPILYLLAMAGVAAGVLFSGYSQILRTNISITNATMAKGDLNGSATTLAATSVFTNDQSIFCPPGGSGMSADCLAASAKIKLMAFASAEASRRPTNYANAAASGAPTEVGVFSAGAGVKQLDPWGRYYIYCRWEQDRNNTDQPSVAVISAGANGTLETACGDEAPGGDDQLVRYNVGTAINRSSVWQQAEGATEANFGPNITVTADGVIEAKGLILSDTATFTGGLVLGVPLPIGSGGTGAGTASGARSNLGATTIGSDVFTATTTGAALTALGGTAMGQYLFTGSALVADTASAVRSTLLGVGEIGDALFLAATATEGRAVLGSTAMGDYLFSSSALDATTASSVRSTLLGASTIGNSVFTAATTELALTGLGASDIGKAIFIASDAPSARTNLGAGETGSTLFTAATQLQAWEILGLTGSLVPTLNVDISGEAGSVDAANLTGGAVPIAHGGTSATNASNALDNLFGADTTPSSTINMGRIAPHSIGSGKLDDIVAAGTYNLIEVDSAGRVVAGSYITYNPDEITDGAGDGIVATADGGGYLYFSTASAIRMTLSPLGYLGLGITQPQELLHLYGGDARISGLAETTRELQFATGTSGKRWVLGANDAAESGSSAGSNFIINRVTDGGSELTTLTIDRATGNATFTGQVAATGGFLGVFTGTFTGTVIGGSTLGVSPTQTAPSRSGDLTTGLFSDTAATVSISTGGIERVRVGSDGSVDIGTTAAGSLDVNGGASAHLVHFTGTTTGQGTMGGTATGSAGAIQFNDGMNALGADSDLTWGLVSKYLGVGTNAPRASLDVGYRSDAIIFPSGTSAERPSGSAAVAGMIRYNESLNAFEAYQGAVPAWGALGGTATITSGVLLGENAGATNPQRSGEAGTGLFSDATGVVAISSLGTERLRVTATGSVGIGTGAPAYALDVQAGISRFLSPGGTSGVEIGVGQTANNFAFIDLVGDTTYTDYGLRLIRSNTGENANAQLINRGTGWLTLTAADAGAVAIQTNGSTRLLVTATGSVGIGTPTPAVTLDLSAKTDALRVPVGTTEQRPSLAVGLLRYNSSLATLEAYINGAWSSLLTSTSTEIGSRYLGASTAATSPAREGEVNTGLFSPATGVVGIASLGAEALRVTATGSVGIGTSAPAQKLDVAGSVNLTGNLGVGTGGVYSGYGINVAGTATDAGQKSIQTILTTQGDFSGDRTNVGVDNRLTNSANKGSFSHNLYANWNHITNANGSNYDNAFGVYGLISNEDSSLTNATSVGAIGQVRNMAGGTLTSGQGVYGMIRNNSTGTITTAHGSYSHVWQDGSGTISTSYGYYSRLDRDAGTMGTGYLYYGVYEGTHTTKYGIYLTGETSNYLSGSLGVGIAAPTAQLHLYSATNGGDLGISQQGSVIPYMRLGMDSSWVQYVANNAYWTGAQYNYVNTGGYGGLASRIAQVSGTIRFDTASGGANPITWSNRMFITATGSVGIGTTTPGYPLDVSGTLGVNGAVISTAINNFRSVYGDYGAFFRNDGSHFYLLLTNSGDQYGTYNSFRPFTVGLTTGNVAIGGGTTLYVENGGEVGIGTDAPTYPLHVVEDSTTAASRGLHVVHTGAVSGIGYAGVFSKTGASTTNIGLYTQASGGTANYGLIVAAGNVGVKTTAPTVSLHVNATDAIQIPVGTTVQRPTAATGQIRYNSTLSQFEGYNGSAWVALGASSSGYERVSQYLSCYLSVVGTRYTCSVSCSSGKSVLGGGGSGFTPSTFELHASYPSATNTWTIVASTATAAQFAYVYAICASM